MGLDPSCRAYTAFAIPGKGLYEYCRLPQGMSNSSATFNRMLYIVLSPVLGITCFAYMDDIICFSNDFDSLLKHLSEIFDLLKKAGLKLNVDKCVFAKSSVKFLGYVVGNNEIRQNPRIKSNVNIKVLQNVNELK